MSKKAFVVTGGSSGIGLATIDMLSRNPDYMVISFSRSIKKIERALETLKTKPTNLEFFEGDVRNQDDVKSFASHMSENHRELHGLVNAAGVLTKGGIEMISYEQWKYNLDINLNGPYLLTQELLPLLKNAGGASIVNISSIAALRPGSSVAYSVSKAGLDMLTEFLAGDLAPYKIRVNSVNPGFVRTNIHLDNKIVDTNNDYEKLAAKVAEKYPLERIGEPNEVAELIVYLLENKAAWITGSIFKIDGGALVVNDLLPPKKQEAK